MKKMFLFAAAAMVSLSSCVQTEEVYTGKLQELGFKSAVTRSIVDTIEDLVYPIAVSGVLDNTDDGIDNYSPYLTNSDPLAKYDNALFVYDESTENWCGSPARYWPSSGDMYFLAFCPCPTNATLKTNYNATTGKIDNLTVTQIDNNIVNQHDILYSDLIKVTAPKTEPQALHFHHALTQIKVAFKKTESEAKVVVNSVMLEDVFFAGNLVITPVEGGNSTASWTTAGEEFAKSRYFNKNLQVSGIEDGTLDEILSSSTAYSPTPLLIIPSTKQGKIRIVYTVSDNKPQTYELDLSTNGEAWEMGKKYTYNFLINVNEIRFKCSIDEWVSGNGDDGDDFTI